MASLTGNSIASTYNGLLKFNDNDAVESTLKNVTDGVGGATALNLGSSAAGVNGGFSVTGSTILSGSATISNVLTLTPLASLPTGQPTGSIAVSGSGVDCKPYFYNGTTWTVMF